LDEDESVISVAAPRGPELVTMKVKKGGKKGEGEWEEVFKKENDSYNLREKIRLIYWMAGWNGVEFLSLVCLPSLHNLITHMADGYLGFCYLYVGAMGCGAYHCPAPLVAWEMKKILEEEEFRGWFRRVIVAVYSTARNGLGNF
jgi:hypothetical protein